MPDRPAREDGATGCPLARRSRRWRNMRICSASADERDGAGWIEEGAREAMCHVPCEEGREHRRSQAHGPPAYRQFCPGSLPPEGAGSRACRGGPGGPGGPQLKVHALEGESAQVQLLLSIASNTKEGGAGGEVRSCARRGEGFPCPLTSEVPQVGFPPRGEPHLRNL